eukprot:TRINITY_DN2801_c0_g1_i2.p1 TRINITY_DN2801_c0_g1~~TRINITY_DN2801_c0_g1_i2.p1  ORF type:complete len:232 (+),score=69.65 TRINITY_DN2801_c0_g1_i2:47-697(+)
MDANNSISFIIFDVGGVLARDLTSRVFEHLFSQHEELYTVEERAQIKKTSQHLMKEYKIGGMDENKYLHELIETTALKGKETSDSLKERIRTDIEHFPEIIAVARRLSQLPSLKLGIISNHTTEWFNFIFQKFLLNEIFTDSRLVVVSCQDDIRCGKPHREIYEKLFLRIQSVDSKVHPSNCLVIDDKEANVKASQDFGFRGLMFNAKPRLAFNID